ncbi:hypothetical protein [Clostridium sp. DJ247]|uniref:hypothetical protein n=1 Tax=Clostridium sp. DJ247 TaxID=2726188 RepID=UPI0016243C2C|nr:hypothetical protein [Clostridium sp. DJ247]MBC2582738.1 hypothetical protein [Clostridium sp. DJ247]
MNKKTKKLLSTCAVASVLVTSSVATVTAKAAEVKTTNYTAIASGQELKNDNYGDKNLRLFDSIVNNWIQYVEKNHPQGLHAIADVSTSNHKLTIKLVNPNKTLDGAYNKFVNKYNLQNALNKAQNTIFDETNGYAVTKVIKVSDDDTTIYDDNSQDKTVSALLKAILSLNDLQNAQELASIQYKDLEGNYKVYLKYKGKDISTPYLVKITSKAQK